MRIVLDSITFKIALTTDEEELKKNILKICDEICITKRINEEYSKPSYYFDALIPEMQKLKSLKPPKIIEPKLDSRPDFRGIRASHRAFLEEAIRIRAHYFITANPIWLAASKHVEENYGLNIISPEQYIKKRKRN